MTRCDVLVIGAGPAGSLAAMLLALQGHAVLQVDRSALPREKACGGALIADSIRCLERHGLLGAVAEKAHALPLLAVYSPSRIRAEIPGRYLTIKRADFDAILQQAAMTAGASFRRACITAIEGNTGTGFTALTASGERISCRAVVVASGATTSLDLPDGTRRRHRPSAIALRCYLTSRLDLDELIISYDASIAPGYAWIFPLGHGEFNVGCGVFHEGAGRKRLNLLEVLGEFFRHFPVARELMQAGGSLGRPRGAPLQCNLTGLPPLLPSGVVSAGEAVGVTYPFTGEGIGTAMESAELAARAVGDFLRTGAPEQLNSYPRDIEAQLEPRLRGYRRAQKWLSRPWLSDFMHRRLARSDYLGQLASGILQETGDPRSIFSLRGVLLSLFR